jgi:hypothetical protein
LIRIDRLAKEIPEDDRTNTLAHWDFQNRLPERL